MTGKIGSSFPLSQVAHSNPLARSPRENSTHPNYKDARSAPVTPARVLPSIDRSQVDPAIVEAAEGMETMFVDYMMKVMRQTVPKNEMDLESPATDVYRGMLDSEYAKKAVQAGANGGGLGLADQVIAYLQSRSYNGRQEPVHPDPEKKDLAPKPKERP